MIRMTRRWGEVHSLGKVLCLLLHRGHHEEEPPEHEQSIRDAGNDVQDVKLLKSHSEKGDI